MVAEEYNRVLHHSSASFVVRVSRSPSFVVCVSRSPVRRHLSFAFLVRPHLSYALLVSRHLRFQCFARELGKRFCVAYARLSRSTSLSPI